MILTFSTVDDTGRTRGYRIPITEKELGEREPVEIAQAEVDAGLPGFDHQASEWDANPRLDPDSVEVEQ